MLVLVSIASVLGRDWNPATCPDVCRCYYDMIFGNYVDCRNRGLTEVPSDIPQDTQLLDLGDNQITSLSSLPDLPQLQGFLFLTTH